MTTGQEPSIRRWTDYFLRSSNAFASFWEPFLQLRERHLLFVVGLGFDPRMCSAIKEIMGHGGIGKRDCLLIAFDEGPDSPSQLHHDRVQLNQDELQQLMADKGEVTKYQLRMWSADGHRIGSRNAASIFHQMDSISQYTDIIVDVSALPQSIYFPLIGKLLLLLDSKKGSTSLPNLHVVVAESPDLDRIIHPVGIDDDATYLHGFSGGIDLEATAEIPRLWIPILGEDRDGELIRIYDLVQPDEICPVLPFPSGNPRRGDDLILEYRELLFDGFLVEPTNIIFASEKNPFEVYRELARTVDQWSSALKPLGSCKVVISALSSKILSLGALLAAYELKRMGQSVGIGHVESRGYTISDTDPNTLKNVPQELFEIWLTGECYAT